MFFILPGAIALLLPHVAAQLSTSTVWLPPSTSVSGTSDPLARWSDLMGNLLVFYDLQTSGPLDNVTQQRAPWRNASALQDGSDWGLDLTGGFYDAGDYIKATYPFSTALASIAWGGIDFGLGYESANQMQWLDKTLRSGLDWLMKCHPENNTLFVDVGDTNSDNAYWGGDLNLPEPRLSYQVNASAPGTDVAASAAAAFAASSILYSGSKSLLKPNDWSSSLITNETYANTLLQHAISLYNFATSTTHTTYGVSSPAGAAAYNSSRYDDSLVWGGLWLYLATNQTSYFDDALNVYWSSSDLYGSNEVFNWDSKIPGLAVLLSQILTYRAPSNPTNTNATLAFFQAEAERYFDRIVINGAGKQSDSQGVTSYLTKGGLLWYPTDSGAASLNPAMNAAMLLFRYAPLATMQNRTTSYEEFAQSQVDYALGKNPMNVPYVVGMHPNSPTNPHSAPASGGDNINDIDNDPEQEAYVLYGATVGGPDEKDRFFDIRSDWPQTEIALDYQPPFLAVAARMLAVLKSGVGSTSSSNTTIYDPYYVNVAFNTVVHPKGKPTDDAFPNGGGSGLSGGAIAAAVVVPILAVIAAIIGVFWWKKGNPIKYYPLRGRKRN